MKLELVLLPVSDVDRAKGFYMDKVGFGLHVDHRASDTFRVVQLDPPGSVCSISFGTGITDAEPGSARGMHLVVSDIVAAREELVRRGVDVSEVRHPSANRLQLVRQLRRPRWQHVGLAGARPRDGGEVRGVNPRGGGRRAP